MKFNVGNYVLYDGQIHIVDEVSKEGIKVLKHIDGWYRTAHYFDVQPLPITPDVLIKFGFNKQGWMYVHNGDERYKSFLENIEPYYFPGLNIHHWKAENTFKIKLEPFTFNYLRNVQFIHQIQNLFESIEEKELVLKIENP